MHGQLKFIWLTSFIIQMISFGAHIVSVTSTRTLIKDLILSSVQFSSVTQSCPTLCNPMNRSTPGLPVHYQLLEFTQTHVHRVGDAIQPSPLGCDQTLSVSLLQKLKMLFVSLPPDWVPAAAQLDSNSLSQWSPPPHSSWLEALFTIAER